MFLIIRYNVTFFDSLKINGVTRAWIKSSSLQPFDARSSTWPASPEVLSKKMSGRLRKSIAMAEAATQLDVVERRTKYSFANRFPGPWGSAIDVNSDDEEDKVVRSGYFSDYEAIEMFWLFFITLLRGQSGQC